MKGSRTYLTDLPKRRRRQRVVAWALSLFILLCLCYWGITWLLFRSPLFRVSAVKFEGVSTVSEADVQGLIDRAIFHQTGWRSRVPIIGRMFSWPDRLTQDDLSFLPRLKEVVIRKDYLRRSIMVRVTERDPAGIWCFAGTHGATTTTATSAELSASFRCGWFDGDGILFERAPRGEGSLIQSVDDYSGNDFRIGSMVLPVQFMPNLISILSTMRSSGVNVKEIRIEDLNLEEVKATTYDGPDILFSLRFPAEDALPVLQSLFTASTSSVAFKNLHYIDFRVEHRAYYK